MKSKSKYSNDVVCTNIYSVYVQRTCGYHNKYILVQLPRQALTIYFMVQPQKLNYLQLSPRNMVGVLRVNPPLHILLYTHKYIILQVGTKRLRQVQNYNISIVINVYGKYRVYIIKPVTAVENFRQMANNKKKIKILSKKRPCIRDFDPRIVVKFFKSNKLLNLQSAG